MPRPTYHARKRRENRRRQVNILLSELRSKSASFILAHSVIYKLVREPRKDLPEFSAAFPGTDVMDLVEKAVRAGPKLTQEVLSNQM